MTYSSSGSIAAPSAGNRAHTDIEGVTLRLLQYCRDENWAGYDPYDALNSPLFHRVPLLDQRLFRLVLTQALKRSPVNIRPLFGIEKTQNPKALALFLVTLLKLSRLDLLPEGIRIQAIIDQLIALRSPDTRYWCWGYSFPWQTRTIVVPRGTPNLVCTTFVAGALLDAFDELGDPGLLQMAVSAGDYIVNDLYYTEDNGVAAFSYPLPNLPTKVHNANLLGAALLCRLFHHTGNERLLEPALRVARYSASTQKKDGSWDYGESSTQRWVDNFHTGYNLTALRDIGRYLRTTEFEHHVRSGFQFYRNHFVRSDGAARYFHDRTYPIDIHCVAQSILTLVEFDEVDLARSVYNWALNHMWNDAGYFYYRVLRTLTIRTSYMRWSQAWMLLACTALLERLTISAGRSATRQASVAVLP